MNLVTNLVGTCVEMVLPADYEGKTGTIRAVYLEADSPKFVVEQFDGRLVECYSNSFKIKYGR